jgi:hypothetical protein
MPWISTMVSAEAEPEAGVLMNPPRSLCDPVQGSRSAIHNTVLLACSHRERPRASVGSIDMKVEIFYCPV